MFPLGVTAELNIGGTWTDISGYLYVRDGINITGGAVNWGDTPQPAQCTFTVSNQDGRFSPNLASGAYYPYLTRNVQVRISVTATSSSGNFYSGFRFWGSISEWPPLSDISGNDVYVQVTAHGPLRRALGGAGQGSALTRYYSRLTGAYAPVAYWPCEEDPSSGSIGDELGGNPMTVITGKPAWKAIASFNGSAPVAVLNNSTWDGLTGSFGTSGDDIFVVPGTHVWVASTPTVNAKVWGAGGGGENGYSVGPNAGGSGEFAQEATLAVTPGQPYTVVVGAGGSGGGLSGSGANRDGSDGGLSSFQGDSVIVRAHGGKGGNSVAPGAKGTGSTNSVHHDGAVGGQGAAVSFGPPAGGAGGGGASSGGTAAAGHAGFSTSTGTGAAGGAAVTGGGAGGHGGSVSDDSGITPGAVPGGGGGAGAFDFRTGAAHSGASGAPGKVELVYTPTGGGTLPNNNVLRFLLFVPAHGGNNGRVLVRALTGGTIAQLDVEYVTGGKIRLKGYSGALALLFTSGNLTVGDGQTLLVSAELAKSGTAVAWKLTAIVPGAAAALGSVAGTQASATMGNVTEVLVAPNADITKTAIGHISVQYALADIRKVSAAINGHDTEMSIDRFIRLANEQALDAEPQFNETADHWGFEPDTQGWTASNASVTRSGVTLSGTPWSFACNGTPANGTYYIATNAQAAQVQPGDTFTDTLNIGKTFTVRAVGPNFAGFNNVTFYPQAAVIMGASDTVTQVLGSGWPSAGSHSLLITAAGGGGVWSASSPAGTSGQPVQPGDLVSAAADVYAPAALGAVTAFIGWYTAGGVFLSSAAGAAVTLAAGDTATVHVVNAKAPATAAFFNITVGDNETKSAGTLLYADNVRVSPRMGVQTRKEYAAFLREIAHLDQGILKESRIMFGLGYRTRIAMISQAPAVTLNYADLSPPLAPVVDLQKITNRITVSRHTGSKITVSLDGGVMSTQEPPAGIGLMITTAKFAASHDAQLAALAAHLLNLGTVQDERYPQITVDLARASIPGNALAPLMSAVANAEIGDVLQLTGLPFWMPSTTTKQLIIGYTEYIGPRAWKITFNCVPEAGWEITSTALRRW